MSKAKAIIVDIDSTIANNDHRQKHLTGKKDWDKFFDACEQDKPITASISMVQALEKKDLKIVFISGRPENYKEKTENWLKKHVGLKKYELLMRPNKNFNDVVEIKRNLLNSIRYKYEILFALEDNEALATMWEEENIPCIKIPGNLSSLYKP